MSREGFEKLTEVAELLKEAVFDGETGEYVSYWSYKSGYLNGAFYAYQEQQNKINKAIKHPNSVDGLVWYEEVKELLK